MASAFESISTASSGSATTTVTVSKPSGLAEGDLMIAIIQLNSNTPTITPKSDWKNLSGALNAITTGVVSTEIRYGFQYKLATSSDVAASNFSWTIGSSPYQASILRFSGAGDVQTSSIVTSTSSTSSPSYANTVTPTHPCTLMFVVGFRTVSYTVSGYAIATDNPTWTERVDQTTESGSVDIGYAIATGSRSALTATGNSSASFNPGPENRHYGAMIVLRDSTNATGSANLLSVQPDFFSMAGTAGTTSDLDFLEASPTFAETDGIEKNPQWTYQDKSTGGLWTYQDKS